MDLRTYIPNTIGDNMRVFNLYACHSQTDISNNIYSGAYVFYIYNFVNLPQRKHTIHESGGGATFEVLNNNTLRFRCDTNAEVYVVLNLLS
jgi:hypothetical protein